MLWTSQPLKSWVGEAGCIPAYESGQRSLGVITPAVWGGGVVSYSSTKTSPDGARGAAALPVLPLG